MADKILTDEDYNIQSINYKFIAGDTMCQAEIAKLKGIEHFLGEFGYLTLGRDFISSDRWTFSAQNIAISIELTMGSIICCCENGCIADANTLLRKYRDDLFFYLYLAACNVMFLRNPTHDIIQKMRKRIDKWTQNEQKDLQIKEVLSAIEIVHPVKEVIEKYNLRHVFSRIARRLNNFVHSNGYAFYNRNINAYRNTELYQELKSLIDDAIYLTVVFVCLLSICAPQSIMSTDYIDFLNCGDSPPDGSQYWVAPFISEFIDENAALIDNNALEYFKDRCVMDL